MLQRRQSLAGQPRALAQRLSLGISRWPREERLGPQPRDELPGCLAPKLQSLGRALQSVERRGRPFAAPRRACEFVLDPVALGQELLEPLVDTLPRERHGRAPLLDLRQPLVHDRQVELG